MEISGVSIDSAISLVDPRGSFQKVHYSGTSSSDWENLAEVFLTKSIQGAVRGMHLQWGTCSANKFVKCVDGVILDILIDVRLESPTFRNFLSIDLNASDNKVVTIPHGVAHGYQVLSKDAMVIYGTDQDWCAECDIGLHPNSFADTWPITPITISERDSNLPLLEDFIKNSSMTRGSRH